MTRFSVWLKNSKDSLSSAQDAAEAQFGWSVKWERLNILSAAVKDLGREKNQRDLFELREWIFGTASVALWGLFFLFANVN